MTTRARCFIAVTALATALGGNAHAQPAARLFRESVSLAVDAEAARTLLTLEDRWAAGQWEPALDALIELVETRGHVLVQADSSTAGGVARYVRVQLACDRLLAALPPAGLEAYRRRVGPRARRLWELWAASQDVAALERLAEQMFFSRYGDRAAWELGRQAWARGELSVARGWWHSLLPAEQADEAARERRFPDTSLPLAGIAARLILCQLLEGDLIEARQALDRFSKQHPTAQGSLAGRDGLWTDLLHAELQAATKWLPPPLEDDLPTFAGNDARNGRSPRGIDLGGELWSTALPLVRLPTVPRNTLFPPSAPVTHHPSVVDDIVYLNDGDRIFAWRLDSGRPAFGNSLAATGQIFPAVDVEPPLEPRRPVSGAPRWTVTVHGGRLYARMGSAVTTPSPLELRDQRTELVCLDLSDAEGRLLWTKSGDQIVLPGDNDDEVSWSWEGSPVAAGGRLYAVLSRRRPQLAWAVACLDAETGLVLWQQPVGITRPTPPDNENLASQLLLTWDEDRLYLSTDHGAVAALAVETGQLLWAVSYESEPPRWAPGQPAPRWIGPPCVAAHRRVFSAPLDADGVFCFAAATGWLQWQQRLPDRVRHILGTASGRVIVAGDALWALDQQTGEIAWSVQPTEPELAGYGRGWIAGDQLLWPSREGISIVDVRTGQVLREQPLLTPTSRRFGGNLVVSGGVMLVASADRLTAYGEYARLETDQEQKLSARPDDHRAQRRLADIATALGQHQRARELMAAIQSRPVPAQPVSKTARLPHDPAPRPVIEPVAARTSGYWTRAWQHPLEPLQRAHSLGDVVLLESRDLTALDRQTGLQRWSMALDRPVRWAGAVGDELVWTTDAEIVVVAPQSGKIQRRRPWPMSVPPDEPRQFRIERTAAGLMAVHPIAGLGVCDFQTGDWRWRQPGPFPGHVTTLAFGPELVGWYAPSTGRAEFRRLADGAVPFRDDAPTAAWQRAPVWSRDGQQFAVIPADGRISVADAHGQTRWRMNGAVEQTHAPPWVFERSGQWFAVLNGLMLARLDSHGHIAWSTGLAAAPLTEPERQLGIGSDVVIAAMNGEIRCLELTGGRMRWSRPLSGTTVRRVLVHDEQALLISEAAPEIEIVSAKTGQRQQQFRLDGPPTDVVVEAHGLLATTNQSVLSLAPLRAVRVAREE